MPVLAHGLGPNEWSRQGIADQITMQICVRDDMRILEEEIVNGIRQGCFRVHGDPIH